MFSVFKQFNGNSVYYTATLKMQITWGNMNEIGVFSIFPETNERLAEISIQLESGETEQIFIQHSYHGKPARSPLVLNFYDTFVLN